MIPLTVELVIVVVDVRPPAVVVREYRHHKQHDHRVAHLVHHHQPHQPLGALVQRYDADHHQHPNLERILRGIEVHVLVRGDARLVRTLEHGVPARARAEALVHEARECLPEVPQHGNVSGRYQDGPETAAEAGQPAQRLHDDAVHRTNCTVKNERIINRSWDEGDLNKQQDIAKHCEDINTQ